MQVGKKLIRMSVLLFLISGLASCSTNGLSSPDKSDIDNDLAKPNISVSLVLAPPPGLNKFGVLNCIAHSVANLSDVNIVIELSDGLELVDGSLQWHGNLVKEQKVELSATVKPVQTGNYLITCTAEYMVDDNRWTILEDVVHLSVTKSESAVINPADASPPAPNPAYAKNPLSSHKEAINIARAYLNSSLGVDFTTSHLELRGVEKRADIPTLWFVIYEYRSNGYSINLSVAIDHSGSPTNPSRIIQDASNTLAAPQEILVSREEAEHIAREKALAEPYTTRLELDWETRRLVWIVQNSNIRGLGDVKGYVIDAENGEIIRVISTGV